MKLMHKTLCIVAIVLCAGVLLWATGCSSAVDNTSSASTPVTQSSPPPTVILEAHSLDSLGYSLQIPIDIGIRDPNPNPMDWFSLVICEQLNTDSNSIIHGSACLQGEYLAIRPRCTYGLNSSDNELCIALLQCYKSSDWALSGAAVAVSGLPVPVVDLIEHIVYADENVVVVDLFPLTDALSLGLQLQIWWKERNYEEQGISYEWVFEVADYVTKGEVGIGRFICEE